MVPYNSRAKQILKPSGSRIENILTPHGISCDSVSSTPPRDLMSLAKRTTSCTVVNVRENPSPFTRSRPLEPSSWLSQSSTSPARSVAPVIVPSRSQVSWTMKAAMSRYQTMLFWMSRTVSDGVTTRARKVTGSSRLGVKGTSPDLVICSGLWAVGCRLWAVGCRPAHLRESTPSQDVGSPPTHAPPPPDEPLGHKEIRYPA